MKEKSNMSILFLVLKCRFSEWNKIALSVQVEIKMVHAALFWGTHWDRLKFILYSNLFFYQNNNNKKWQCVLILLELMVYDLDAIYTGILLLTIIVNFLWLYDNDWLDLLDQVISENNTLSHRYPDKMIWWNM